MTNRIFIVAICAIIFAACSNSSNKLEEPTTAHLGDIEFVATGAEEAQPHFQKGLLLMHSFEFKDAEKSFQEAIKIDPDFYLAYWGEAMTHNHPLWSARYQEEGEKALANLAATTEERLALAPTEMERDFMQGVEILYQEGEKVDNDQAYSAHMKKMAAKYPQSHEVAAFYALSLLGAAPERDTAVYAQGAEIVKAILTENPKHPGALHYLIHAYDDPWHAHLALDAANNYSVVAPDAGHALHMPSHIYTAMGMWDEVITSNIASFNASDARRERLDLDSDARSYHALHWLMYGYVQQANVERARELLVDMQRYDQELSSKRARAHLTMMRSNFVIDANAWKDEFATLEIDDADLNIGLRSVNAFNEGYVAHQSGDLAALEVAADKLTEMRNSEYSRMMKGGATMCSGVSWASQLPTEADINRAQIMELELKAYIAMHKNDDTAAEKYLTQAVELEEVTPFIFGPPLIAKPSRELYGDWLASKGAYAKAVEQYQLALDKAPGRLVPTKAMEACQDRLNTI